MEKKLAAIISGIFQPVFMPTIALMILFSNSLYKEFFSTGQRAFILSGVFFFTGLLTIICVLLMKHYGKVSNVFVSNKDERLVPYLVSLTGYILCVPFLWLVNLNHWVIMIALGGVLGLIVMIVVNRWWKISAHLSGMGAFCGSIFAGALQLQLNPVLLFCIAIFLSGAVASARIYLRAHTPGQTAAGFAVGLLTSFVPAIFF